MSNGNDAGPAFESFFHGWLQRQQRFLDELLSVQGSSGESLPPQVELEDLVRRVLAHYQQYYEKKSRQARCNIFMLFSPARLLLDRRLQADAGFSAGERVGPRLDGGAELEDRQAAGGVPAGGEMLNDKLAKIQESVAAPPIMELARRPGQRQDSVVVEDKEAINGLRTVTEALVANADLLRTSTAAKAVEILSPAQNVRFLAAAARPQLRIRSWGLERAESDVKQTN